MYNNKSIIAITWDGKSQPFQYIHFDIVEKFDWLLYDYSGNVENINHISPIPKFYISKKSECKGDVITNIYDYLLENQINNFPFIGLLDDDLFFSTSDLNKLLFIAEIEKLDVFQASLSHDSYFHHRQFVNKPGYNVQKTDWVEIMAPFYSNEVFFESGKYFNKSISGTGIDVYLIPVIQKIINKTNTVVIHSVIMKHCRPIRTDFRIFSNGKDNLQEIEELRLFCIELIKPFKNVKNDPIILNILNRKYIHSIPFKYKIRRILPMLKNIYKMLVDASYR
jgi:hypothetical protein